LCGNRFVGTCLVPMKKPWKNPKKGNLEKLGCVQLLQYVKACRVERRRGLAELLVPPGVVEVVLIVLCVR
jgi:hypothetical protein